MKHLFPDFSNTDHAWIYGFEQVLETADKRIVEQTVDAFIHDWKAHGKPVKGDFAILYDQFVVVIAENNSTSGCSIDACVRLFKQLRDERQLDALNRSLIFYRNGEGVRSVDRPGFKELVKESRISSETTVFNLAVETVGGIRSGKFETTFQDSWHAKAFPLG